ncbi:MAG: succinate--CoA ligase [Firmicutes bacterium HGW-Firmicutes-19]|jgi:succinyl-CoA synthetase beta subunit|nr:MAG: succinate--CoA ligase [Firmicutes bacterium HGW-Firmicutes-19]
MKLYEYQVKELFKNAQIAIPKSQRITAVEQASEAFASIGFPCVIKSQVLSGGRGKAGLIQFVKDEKKGLEEVVRLFSLPQKISSLLIEEAIDIAHEVYASFTIDPISGTALSIVSATGGVDIETLAIEQPEKILQTKIDMSHGLQPYQASHIAYECGFDIDVAKKFAQLLMKLYRLFVQYDCELLEINPLFITKSNELVAGDGKCSIDDNSMFRHEDISVPLADIENEAERLAMEEGIPFIQFDGDISLMCAGAGLTTTVYDLINYEGGTVANYLEFGGPHYKKAMKAMEICLKVPSKVILIVTFGTIARADVMAQGIVEAITQLKPDRPIITCIRGTNEIEAVEILKKAGLIPLFDTEEAVRLAVTLAKEAKI